MVSKAARTNPVRAASSRAGRTSPVSREVSSADLDEDRPGKRRAFLVQHHAANRRPGSNVTGVFLDFPDFSKKWLQALKEVVPQTSAIAMLWDPATGSDQRSAVEAAGVDLNLTLVVLEVRVTDDLERALRSAKDQRVGGLVALSSPLIGGQTKLLAELAMKFGLPAITLFAEFARDGGLMTYGPSIQAVIRQQGVIAAKVLLGSSPAETPIETPTR